MGDRGNIAVLDWNHTEDKPEATFFYSHWGGTEMPNALLNALARGRERWFDPPYFARIVFDSIKADDIESTTGYGVSATMGDNEYPVLVVDCKQQRVLVVDEAFARDRDFRGKEMSFDEYLAFGEGAEEGVTWARIDEWLDGV